MKTILKLLAFFILASLIALSCSKDQSKNEGIITGADARLCMCCGGWFIDIEGDHYRFYQLPKDCELDLSKETFPLAVTVKWSKMKDSCLGDEIELSYLAKK